MALSFHCHSVRDEATFAAHEVDRAVTWLQALRPGRVSLHGTTPILLALKAGLASADLHVDGPLPETPRCAGQPGESGGFRVTLAVVGLGWMEARLEFPDGNALTYPWSYLTKPWRDTISGLSRAVTGEAVAVPWYEEPGSHQFVLRPQPGGSCVIEIRYSEGLFGRPDDLDEGHLEYALQAATTDIARAFLDASRLLLEAGSPADFEAAGIDVPPDEFFADLKNAIARVSF